MCIAIVHIMYIQLISLIRNTVIYSSRTRVDNAILSVNEYIIILLKSVNAM